MIISASRRTDIPAFYSDWFYERIQTGDVLVRNPFNAHQVRKISLSPEAVECIVFWTKNPEKMLSRLPLIDEYRYYFHFTLNPYDASLEPRVPRRRGVIETFQKLAWKIGPERVVWRYDPIIITDRINDRYHYHYFAALAARLHGSATKCVISFVDFYPKVHGNLKKLGAYEISPEEKVKIASKLGEIGRAYGFKVETCAEDIDLSAYGIGHAKCIDPDLIESIWGVKIKAPKDKNQRKACACGASVDIGAYRTCGHGCVYCYANN